MNILQPFFWGGVVCPPIGFVVQWHLFEKLGCMLFARVCDFGCWGISMELLGIPNVWRKMSSSHPLKIRDKWSKIKIPTVLGHFHFDSYFRIGFFTTTEVLFHASFWGKKFVVRSGLPNQLASTVEPEPPQHLKIRAFFQTGCRVTQQTFFLGAYKVFETILAFALLKVALLICCAYLFF